MPIASASSVQYVDGKLYIIGDDSPYILVCEGEDYNTYSRIPLIDRPEKRIPKPEKPDFESSLITDDGQLLIIGSASTNNRELFALLPLDASNKPELLSSHSFFERVKQQGAEEVNVESAALISKAGKVILSLRGNLHNPTNRFIITGADFYKRQADTPIIFSDIVLPVNESFSGISDFAYLPEKDMLFFTASTELTANTYDDGPIGDSYLGWVEGISTKLEAPVQPTAFYNLTQLDERFKGQKIEGVCVRWHEDGKVKLVLVTDDDKSETSNLYEAEIFF